MHRSSGFWWGVILIVIGALFLLENLDILSVDVAIRDYWPLLLVLWGAWILTRGVPEPVRPSAPADPGSAPGGPAPHRPSGDPAAAVHSTREGPWSRSGTHTAAADQAPSAGPGGGTASGRPPGNSSGRGSIVLGDLRERTVAEKTAYSTVFGELDVAVEAPAYRGGSFSTVFGRALCDLSRAGWAEGEQVVKVTGIFGDITVLLPPGAPYALSAYSMFGGISAGGQRRDGISSTLKIAHPEGAATTRKLRLDLSTFFGDITVRG